MSGVIPGGGAGSNKEYREDLQYDQIHKVAEFSEKEHIQALGEIMHSAFIDRGRIP